MKVLYTRKNRKTRGKIQLCGERIKLHRPPYTRIERYWAQCEHGSRTYKFRRKSSAVDKMAHPDKWCDECEKVVKAKAEGKR